MARPAGGIMSDVPEDARLFGVDVGFDRGHPVLNIRGQVDMATAHDLSAMLHSVIDQGHSHVLVNLAALDFMDASGLGVLATASARLRGLGGMLGIGAPSQFLRKVLAIVGMNDLELVPDSDDELTPTKNHPETTEPAEIQAPRGGRIALKSVMAIPASDDVVDSALRLVVALARATVGGADGVSISLRRHGRLSTVAASDTTILQMDADQYATGEGPCISASETGLRYHAESLLDELRWPAFVPQAASLGINAILSSPLLSRDTPVGALNIYSRTPLAFAPKDQELAATFAREASLILWEAGLDTTDEDLAARLQTAMRARQVIAQAQGIIMHRDGLAAEEAYAVLRRNAQSANTTIREYAELLLASVLSTSQQAKDRGLNR